MLRLLLLFMLLPFGFIAAWAGWPWLIFIVTALVAIYGYVFLMDTPGGKRITFFITIFAFQALIAAWIFYQTLQDVNPRRTFSPTGEQIFEAFFGTDLLKLFWAVAGGLILASFLLGAVILAFTLVELPSRDKSNGDTMTRGFTHAMRRAMGLVPAEWVVREGEVKTVRAPKSPQPALTGPGEIEVQLGHAVILEQDGAQRRVLPCGVAWVNKRERIAMVVPLYGRVDVVPLSDVVTHDGLTIKQLELTIFHKVDPGTPPTHQVDSQFPYSEDILLNQIWSASGKDWRDGVKGVTGREARNLISDLTLEDFLTLSSQGRDEFKKRLEPRINAVTRNLMGVGVTVTGIGAVTLPTAAADKLTERWTAVKDHQIEVETATGRKEAFTLLHGAMSDALDKQPAIKDLLVLSFIERMEHDGNHHQGDKATDLDTMIKFYLLEALKDLNAPKMQGGGRSTSDAPGQGEGS